MEKTTRRDMLKLAGGVFGGAVLSGCATASHLQEQATGVKRPIITATPDKPNIFFILADDLGWMDLGCYWHPVLKTPHLDQLAAEGCRFTNFYSTAPVCSPSRAGCMTGRIQNRFGMEDVIHPGQWASKAYHHLPLEQPTYARMMREAGYFTGHIGKWHLSLPGFETEPCIGDYGFDYYCSPEGGLRNTGTGYYKDPTDWSRNGEVVKGKWSDWAADLYADETIRFIETAGGQPFLLNLWVHAPHEPIQTAPEYMAMYADRPLPEQTYFGCVTQLDAALGRIFDYLRQKNLDRNTNVIFASDNGPELMAGYELPGGEVMNWGANSRGATPFHDRKHDLHEGGIRVPAIIRWPGLATPDSVSHEPVSLLDLFPTLCAVVGAPQPRLPLDGGDMRPAFNGQHISRPHPLFWQFIYSKGKISHSHWGIESPPLALRDGPWKLMCDMDFSEVQLYNLDVDPAERWNFAKGYPEVTERLMQEMRAIHADVNQPYPSGRYLNPDVTCWLIQQQAREKNES